MRRQGGWVVSRALVAALGLTLAMIVPQGMARAAQVVVVTSTLPVIKPGQLLDERSRLDLPAGSQVGVIDGRGGRHVLRGPYQGYPLAETATATDTTPATAAEAALLSSLARLLGSNGHENLGPSRPKPAKPAPGEPWAIDTGEAGIHCFAGNVPPTLWRADATQPLKATLHRARSQESATLDWPKGVTTLPWPTHVPPRDNENFLLRISGLPAPVTLLLRRLPDGLPSTAHEVAWLADHGCAAQARRLLNLAR